MKRYIDADIVRSAKNPYDEELSEYERGWNAACDAIAEDAPTADVVDKELYDRLLENGLIISEALNKYQTADFVEVVRCRDCKWFDLTDPAGTLSPNAHRCKRVTRLWFEDDAFCAYGVRREE